jgi:hypothetical protein
MAEPCSRVVCSEDVALLRGWAAELERAADASPRITAELLRAMAGVLRRVVIRPC